ncbi:MAG: TRAP transporter large permease [Anaerotignum sp.]|nr:TRAP transporter large permease [Anaerotignum sp.]
MNAGLIVFVALVLLAFLGLPIFQAIAVGTMLAMYVGGFPLEAMAQKTFLGLNSSSLLSIPFFILAGNLMARGITRKLINVANIFLGRVAGGLGPVTILASALFGAISGSAVATVAAIGGMTVPAMKEEGYDAEYSAALASAASLLGPMIPPSITLIVYASLTNASVQKLFMATAIPAILCTILFIIYSLWYGKKHNLPKQPKQTGSEIVRTLVDSVWAMLLPVIVLGLIFSGITTVTAAAAISCIYAAIVALFIYKTMNYKDLLKILADSAVSIAAIMVLVGMSKATAYVVISSQLPQLFMSFISSITESRFVVLLIINLIFLVLGCLMEGNCIIVMMVPLLLNLINAYQIDLVQFGVLSAINIYLGCITPPVGVSLLVGTKIGNTSMGGTFKAILPFLLIALVILMLVTYIPGFTLWLPTVIG